METKELQRERNTTLLERAELCRYKGVMRYSLKMLTPEVVTVVHTMQQSWESAKT